MGKPKKIRGIDIETFVMDILLAIIYERQIGFPRYDFGD